MSTFKLAASNIGWTAASDAAVLGRMAELGFQGIEIAPTRLVANDPYGHAEEAASMLRDARCLFGLAPCSMQSIWRGRSENLFDPAGSEALLAYTERACSFAQECSIPNLVFGCPLNRRVPEGRNVGEAASFFQACGEIAASRGVTIALEANAPSYGSNFLNTTAEVVGFLESLPAQRGLSINLDLGAVIEQDEPLTAIESALPHVSHVHISEPGLASIRPRRLHSELKALLEGFGYLGYVSLEMAGAEEARLFSSLEHMARVFL